MWLVNLGHACAVRLRFYLEEDRSGDWYRQSCKVQSKQNEAQTGSEINDSLFLLWLEMLPSCLDP